MNEEELLNKYKLYRKRNIIMIVIILICIFLFLGGFYVVNNKANNVEPKVASKTKKKKVSDNVKPVLELTEKEIQVEVNSLIDYKSYIQKAKDNKDGNMIDKVRFSKVDTSKTGKYNIVYYVFDSAKNMTQKVLKVNIYEQPQEKIDEPTSNQTTSSNASSTNKKDSSDEKEEKPKSSKPANRNFMFSDGYNITNVVEACASELKKSDYPGVCEPITDENGIYIGMRLIFD